MKRSHNGKKRVNQDIYHGHKPFNSLFAYLKIKNFIVMLPSINVSVMSFFG